MEKGHTIPVHDHGYVRYIDHMGDDRRIVESARISYLSASKGEESDRKLLNYLWRNRHMSPFEMGKVTLNIKMPIFVMRQWARHRMQNLNEVSARYTELPRDFYLPSEWRKQSKTNKQGGDEVFDIHDNRRFTEKLLEHCDRSYALYLWYLEQGVSRELARMVLPLNIYTEIYTTLDVRNAMHLLGLRDDAHAQQEIQGYAKAVKQVMRALFPWTVAASERWKHTVVDTMPTEA